ncbi:MAG: 50S ribosomal protein L5 [bacterium]
MSLKTHYTSTVLPHLKKNLKKNVNALPRLEKVVVNMGIGSLVTGGQKDFSLLEKHLSLITGQKPVVAKARNSISNFKLREGQAVGISTTLRGDRMYDFLEKLIHIVLPRVRDFQGLKAKSMDKAGNLNIGLKEQTLFPEIVQDDIVKTHGIQITIVTKSTEASDSLLLLQQLGIPFTK